MPEGLQDGLSLVEFSDLIAYLENPKLPALPAPAPVATRLRVHAAVSNPVLTASQERAAADRNSTGEELFSPFYSHLPVCAAAAANATQTTQPPPSPGPHLRPHRRHPCRRLP